MGTQRPVVVGIDGSDSALLAVSWGAAEAVRRRVGLRLVIAFEQPRAAPGGVGDVLLERARLRLAEAVEVAVREAPGVGCEHRLVVGHPISVLAAEARRAGLVVVGDRGAGLVEGLPAGSVAVGLAVQAPGTVVVVRGPGVAPREARSLAVVVGIDAPAGGEEVLGFAFEAASTRHVPLVAVHTWSDLAVEPEIAPQLDWDRIDAAARALLAERLEPWTRKYPEVTVGQVVSRDHPARALLRQAAQAQLLVVGPGGRGASAGLLLGSVCHALLHRSPCPVAVVRPDATG
ncbi:universal stress protein [Pseudonocardia abyssalis]|jgi:nucleotide-binding universal stress UspA family protein|uniref:Universal stress protein n=1 Tax=Pseudonocardia abyssalis TaxID=2792008 RepID=A0ABS6USH7_9PSEU|nr:universal stress protein [Pseudonocardia abyssalis]MBW0113866.1 universal stress protein [Pseudonocardia abyssalis]MBW0135137.1 universal stress protein [Pseudonocardia abyssalis]